MARLAPADGGTVTLAAGAAHTCRILSIDGGGIRGVIPATLLSALEKQLGAPLAQHFHLLTGTSTGGILASGLACELPTSQLLDFYKTDGPKIFNGAWLGNIDGPKYNAAVIEDVLKTAFGDRKLSDLHHDLICPAYDLANRVDFLFQSWRARGIQELAPDSYDFPVWQVARSTSAAPTYFAPFQATATDGKTYPLVDGGMYANNPALCGLVAARRLMPLATRYLIVSLGTGNNATPIAFNDAQSWGIVGWGSHLIDIIFDAMTATVAFELDQIDGVDHVRLQSSLKGANDALDDASNTNIVNLEACAARTLDEQKTSVAALLEELQAVPLPDTTALGYPQRTGMPMPPKLPKLTPAVASPTKGALAGGVAGAVVAGPIGALIGGLLGFFGTKK